MNRTVLVILFGCFIGITCIQGEDTPSKNTMVRPVDTDKSGDRSTFQADYGNVWQTLLELLTQYGFKFQVRDKAEGRIETDYVIFSRSPHFSTISNGFRAFATPPRALLKKWDDGKMKVFAEVKKVSDGSTQVYLRPDIYGFAATVTDDSSVTGEWRQCLSNRKFEFEVFNEIATRLQKKSGTETPADSDSKPAEDGSEAASPSVVGEKSNILVSSVPDGAEILLNNQLVGMTPSRLVLKAGKYQVIIRKEGYKKFFRQIIVIQGSDLTFSAELKQN